MKNTLAGEKIIYYCPDERKVGESLEQFSTQKKINLDAIYDFLLYGSILPPNSIYQNIYQLFPGEEISWKDGNLVLDNADYRALAATVPERKSVDCFVKRLDGIFTQYFSETLAKNGSRPVGLMLSGGIDSAILASYLPKEAVCVTWAGWGEHSTDWVHAQKTVRAFGLKNHLQCQVDPEKDFKLCQQALNKVKFPFSFAAGAPYMRMAEELQKKFAGQNYLLFMGENADTISGAFRPTVLTYYISKLSKITSLLPFWKSLASWRRKYYLLSTHNPLGHFAFFHSNGLYPGPWMNVPQSYFDRRLRQLAGQIGRPPKIFSDFILTDELLTEARRDQFMQNYLPGLFGATMALPYFDEAVIKLLLSTPQSIRRRKGFGKIVLAELAIRRGVPRDVVEKGKKGLSYGYIDYLKRGQHLPIWDEMEKNSLLGEAIDIKRVRAEKQNVFYAFDRLRSLHYYLETCL